MNQIILKIVRHALTAFGGAGMATDSNVEQFAGSLSFIIGIIWSIWEVRRADPPKPPGPAVKLSLMAGLLAVLTGCAGGLLPGSDPLVVRAEQTRAIATATFDAFVTLEYRNADLLWKVDPGFKHAADKIRVGAPQWKDSLTKAIAAYKARRDQEARNTLSGSVAFLETALAEVQGYMTQAAEKGAR